MDDPRYDDVRHLLVAAAHAHHAVYGGPNEQWARWYAEWVYGQLLEVLGSHPSVDTVEQWFTAADARYRDERPDGTWPGHYAAWFLEWEEAA